MILIGTSGYSYKDWKGPIYPEKAKPEDYLLYYKDFFNFVEINYTYYRRPEAQTFEKMIEKTPDDFYFAVKAHQSLTHMQDSDIEKEGEMFKKGIQPLVDEKRLVSILFQFPYSFHYDKENRLYLDRLTTIFRDYSIAVEFRNAAWQTDSVLKGCTERGISYVNCDYPSLKGLPTPSGFVTAPTGYLRFHGRNRENWWTGTNISRYDYLYSPDELEKWLPKIEMIDKQSTTFIIAFNNHFQGKAVTNGKMLQSLIKKL